MAWIHHRDKVDDCPSKLRGKRDGSESEHGGANDHEVADRPYNRGENVISHRIAKISRIDRSRFSPSQHGNSCEHSNEGQEYGSERVDVLIGFSVMRPSIRAVGSPQRFAIQACADSCTLMANRNTIN